ncbi:Protein PNS1 [Durusdinium trenchii]|uniref:Choline transporter-like protein n=1 Tax=Durusdinium trenchii TaxID=1381693 RepID=A0ABP0HAF9_9DINO
MATVMATGPTGRASVVDELAMHEEAEVKRGGCIMQENPILGETRACRDVVWGLAFVLVAVFVTFAAVAFAVMLFSLENDLDTKEAIALAKMKEDAFTHGILAVLLAGVCAPLSSIVFLYFTKHYTECVVWCSGLFGILTLAVSGSFMMRRSWPFPGVFGAILVVISVCLAICFLLFGKDFVRFTTIFLKCVLRVVERHPAMLMICFVNGLISALWSLACGATLLSAAVYDDDIHVVLKSKTSTSAAKMGLMFLYALIYYWGSQVCLNTAFTACSGVFCRWYFDKDQGSPAASSLKVAWTSSFGSICYGSFVVAVVRAIEFLVRQCRREAYEEGNYVTCVLLCIVEQLIGCVGDILEWISNFAYVQCALRGLGFCDACRATFAINTYSNVEAITSSLLIDWVPAMAAVLIGGLCGGLGLLTFSTLLDSEADFNTSVFAFCFVVGMHSSWSTLQVLCSGCCSIISCFAEDGGSLRKKDPELWEAITGAQRDDDSSVDSSRNSSRRGSGRARDVRAQPMMEMSGR